MFAIRTPRTDELPALGDLCLRSKAVWGYDETFMAACRAELSFEPRDLLVTQSRFWSETMSASAWRK
jgi:hypothetical protein